MKSSKRSRLPKQVAPVERLTTSVAPTERNGIEASGIFDLIGQLPVLNKLSR